MGISTVKKVWCIHRAPLPGFSENEAIFRSQSGKNVISPSSGFLTTTHALHCSQHTIKKLQAMLSAHQTKFGESVAPRYGSTYDNSGDMSLTISIQEYTVCVMTTLSPPRI